MRYLWDISLTESGHEAAPFCDSYSGHIVAANHPYQVRMTAASKAADEGAGVWQDTKQSVVRRIGLVIDARLRRVSVPVVVMSDGQFC